MSLNRLFCPSLYAFPSVSFWLSVAVCLYSVSLSSRPPLIGCLRICAIGRWTLTCGCGPSPRLDACWSRLLCPLTLNAWMIGSSSRPKRSSSSKHRLRLQDSSPMHHQMTAIRYPIQCAPHFWGFFSQALSYCARGLRWDMSWRQLIIYESCSTRTVFDLIIIIFTQTYKLRGHLFMTSTRMG